MYLSTSKYFIHQSSLTLNVLRQVSCIWLQMYVCVFWRVTVEWDDDHRDCADLRGDGSLFAASCHAYGPWACKRDSWQAAHTHFTFLFVQYAGRIEGNVYKRPFIQELYICKDACRWYVGGVMKIFLSDCKIFIMCMSESAL